MYALYTRHNKSDIASSACVPYKQKICIYKLCSRAQDSAEFTSKQEQNTDEKKQDIHKLVP